MNINIALSERFGDLSKRASGASERIRKFERSADPISKIRFLVNNVGTLLSFIGEYEALISLVDRDKDLDQRYNQYKELVNEAIELLTDPGSYLNPKEAIKRLDAINLKLRLFY